MTEIRSLRRHEVLAWFMAGLTAGDALHGGSWWHPVVFAVFAVAFYAFRKREEATA